MTDVDPERLRAVPLLASLTSAELATVASLLRQESFGMGRSIVREGEVGYDFFVIVAGQADVTRATEVLRQLGPGDFFGEIGIASSDGKRTATVTARTDMEIWTMYGTAVQQLRADHPDIAATLQSVSEQRTDGS